MRLRGPAGKAAVSGCLLTQQPSAWGLAIDVSGLEHVQVIADALHSSKCHMCVEVPGSSHTQTGKSGHCPAEAHTAWQQQWLIPASALLASVQLCAGTRTCSRV